MYNNCYSESTNLHTLLIVTLRECSRNSKEIIIICYLGPGGKCNQIRSPMGQPTYINVQTSHSQYSVCRWKKAVTQ